MNQIRIAGVPEHFNTPWRYALEHALFAQTNLSVKFSEYPLGTGAMCEDLSAGKSDVAITLTEGAVKHCIERQDCYIVAPYVETPLQWGIYVAANSPIQNTDQLLHKQFAISRFGSGSHLMAMLFAKESLKWLPSVSDFVVVGGIAKLCEAVNRGRGDAFLWEVFTTEPWLTKGNIRLVGVYPTPWPCFQITARKDFLERQHQDIHRCLSIVYQIAQQFNQDHEFARKQIEKYYGLASERIRQWLTQTQWSTDFTISNENITRAIIILNQLGLITTLPSAADIVFPL